MRPGRQDADGASADEAHELNGQHWATTCLEMNGAIVKNTDDPVLDNNDPDPLRPQYNALYGFAIDVHSQVRLI